MKLLLFLGEVHGHIFKGHTTLPRWGKQSPYATSLMRTLTLSPKHPLPTHLPLQLQNSQDTQGPDANGTSSLHFPIDHDVTLHQL